MLTDLFNIGGFGGYQVAVTGNVFLAGHDLERPIHHRGEAEVGLIGMETDGLGCPEVLWAAENGGGDVLSFDLSGESNPVGPGMVAFPAVFAFAGQHLQVAGLDGTIALFLEPLIIASERHATVAVLVDVQGFLANTLLDAGDVEKEVILRGLVYGDGPHFVKHIHPLAARLHHESMFGTEGNLLLFAFQIDHLTEFDPAKILGLVPEIHFFPS